MPNDPEWTLETLRIHIERQLTDLRILLDERFDGQHQALTKADQATEKRFDSVNAFRAQQNDVISRFILRAEYEAAHSALVDRVNDLRAGRDREIGEDTGRSESDQRAQASRNQAILWISTLVAVGGLIIAVIVAFGR